MSYLDKRGQIIMQCEATNFKDKVIFFEGVNLFGRNPAKTRVTIKDRSISQIHGKIICKNNTIKLVDTKSKNGIYLNSLENQIEPDTEVEINPKEDIVYFAQIKCKFVLDQPKKQNQEDTKQFIGKAFKANPKITPLENNKQSLQQADKNKNISTKNKVITPQNIESKDVKKTKKQQEQLQKEREKEKLKQIEKQKEKEREKEKEKEKKELQKKMQAQEQKKRKEKEKNEQKKEQKKKSKKQSKQKPTKSNEKQEKNIKIQSKQISENEEVPNYLPKNKKKPNNKQVEKEPVEKPSKQSKENKQTKERKVQKKSEVMDEKEKQEDKQVKKQKQKRGDSGQTKIKLKAKRKNKSLGKIEQIKKQQKLVGRKKAAEQLNQSFASHSRRSVVHKIALISGFTMTFKPTVKITISENWRERFDVLVMDKYSRTFKLLYAICLGIPVVNLNWILQSEYRRGIAPLQRFYLQSPQKDQISSSVSLAKSGSKVFQNMKFFLVETSQSTFHLPVEQIEALLEAGGGTVLKKTIKRQYNIKDIVFLVKNKYDNEQMKALKRYEGAQKIYTIQMVLQSCFYQKIDWDKNKASKL